MSPYSLESFVHEMHDAVAGQADSKLVVDAVSEGVRRLLGGVFFPGEGLLASSSDGFARHQVFQDARLVISTCVWLPGQSTPIHDHATWGVIAGLQGRVIATTYRRADDGATPGFASLSEMSRTLVTEASFAAVRPPEEVVHRFENPFRELAVTLHVFGGSEARERNVYDQKAKSLMVETSTSLFGA